ncbi:MAG TPA: MFS transporter [Gemmatales bacterium]|nr:MFS transporter [Gemmatales bacterium]HMP58654.1 MFS transporter [Gemmatales bacterium]
MSQPSERPAEIRVPSAPARLNPAWSLGMLLAINLLNYIDRYNLAAIVPTLETSSGFFEPGDPNIRGKLGLLMPAFMIAYMLFAPLFGSLGDRYNRWKLIAIGVALWTAATGLCGLATSWLMLLLMRCALGVGEAAYGPVAPAIIADLYPVEKRGQKIAWFYAAIPVGSALGYTLGGQIARFDWRWVFFVMVPPGIIMAILAWFMPDPPRGQSDQVAEVKRRSWKELWPEYRFILSIKSYWYDTVGMIAMTFAMGGVAFWMPYYVFKYSFESEQVPRLGAMVVGLQAASALQPLGVAGVLPVLEPMADYAERSKDAIATDNTIFGAILVVSGLMATLTGGWLGDQLRGRIKGAYFTVSAWGMIAGFGFFLAVLYVPWPLAWVFVFLAVFCLFFNTGPMNAVLANVVPPSLRATAVALNILVIHALGDAISPYIIGFVADKSTLRLGFVVVSVMILASGVIWLIGARHEDPDTLAAPTLPLPGRSPPAAP